MATKNEKTVMKCISCGKRVETEEVWVKFPCPACGKTEIIRCGKCKKLGNVYKCPECGFEGP